MTHLKEPEVVNDKPERGQQHPRNEDPVLPQLAALVPQHEPRGRHQRCRHYREGNAGRECAAAGRHNQQRGAEGV